MLMTLTPSRPSRANTTTITPRILTPIATQRLPALWDGMTKAVSKNIFVQIGEIQTVLVEVSEAFRFVPDNFHYYSVDTIYFIVK